MYQKVKVLRAVRKFGLIPNGHIVGRKEIHENILRHFAQSALKDRKKAKDFIKYVKTLHGQK